MSYIPSFKRELNRLYSVRWIAQQKYEKPHISWDSKLKWREYAEDLDVRVAKIYQVQEDIRDLIEPDQDRWVLKPARGSANRGVFPVIRNGKKWHSIFNNKDMTFKQILSACKSADNVKPPYIIEEFLGDKLPDNVEVYCFNGEVGLIRQRRQLKGRGPDGRIYKFWDENWQPLGEIEKRNDYGEMEAPQHKDEIIEVAQKLSKDLPFVFARIDLYDTDDGVYYGEITMHPGVGNNFNEQIDKKLGRMWLNAEARR